MAGDTIVIGAGPAGLAVAACLSRAGVPCTVLERATQVGASWRAHYDRLHLHTPKEGSALPGLPFPTAVPRYPSRAQVVEYLEQYALRFGVAPRFGEEVVHAGATGATGAGARWRVVTARAEYEASNLVVATGYNHVPHLPSWPGQDEYRGAVLHSSQYRNGTSFRGQAVLVVGFGNSGGEIALDLAEHGARVGMAVRSPVNIVPRDILGIPAQTFSIAERRLPPRLIDAVNGVILSLVKGDLSRYGLHRASVGPATQIAERRRLPLIDVGTVALIKQGRILVHPGPACFTPDGVRFTDGATHRFDAVVLATGYRPRVDGFLHEATVVCDADGAPRESGDPTGLPGLYFCGFRVTATGTLREIGLEAERIANALGD